MNWTRLSQGVAGVATLLLFSSTVNAQVAGSAHDLSTRTGSQTLEVCVYCHTPHGADITAAVPLWNKALPDGGKYTRYSDLGTSTLDGAETDVVGSVSLACLSCHDGSQAMDNVINAPGSGGYNPAGAPIGSVGVMPGTTVAMLGIDLRDDHPIGIEYGGGGLVATDPDGQYALGSTVDPDFNPPVKATINGNPAWWVDSAGGTNARERTDMILYTRDDAPAGTLGARRPFVECGSCHDPHNASTANTVAPNQSVAFLRISNQQSDVCTACHLK